MDTNRILLLMVGFACGLMIVRHVRGRPGHRGWLAVSVTVAVTIAALHFLAPTVAGYLGMVLWGLLVLVPAFGSRWLQRMVGHQQYGRARPRQGAREFGSGDDGVHGPHPCARGGRIAHARLLCSAG